MLSHSEKQEKRLTFRHLLWPDRYNFVIEALSGYMILILLNFTAVGDYYEGGLSEILSYTSQLLENILDKVQQYYVVQQMILFLLWAFAGGLLYVLIFRVIQISLSFYSSVVKGVKYVKKEPTYGVFRWLGSLHSFFERAIVLIIGWSSLLFGVLVCYGVASQQLNTGLATTFPTNMGHFLLSFIGLVLTARLVIIGACLLSKRFGNWYLDKGK